MSNVIKLNSEKKTEVVEQPTSVKDFINDEKCKAIALESAQQIKNLCGDGWFDIIDIVNKFGIGMADGIQKLEALKLFGFIHERMLDGKEKQYKVVLTVGHRLVLVQQDIKFYEDKLVILKKQEQKLITSISKKNGVN